MPIRGINEVRDKLRNLEKGVIHPKAVKAVTEVMIVAAGYAASLTPIDTSNLINSQYREIKLSGRKIIGTIGYTASYAAAVHEMSGKLKGKPRAMFGNAGFGGGTGVGNYWDPDAEPGFLRKAFENADARAAIDDVIKRNMEI